MKTLKYIFSLILILCSAAAGAQVTRMQSGSRLAQEPTAAFSTANVTIADPTAQAPAFTNSNSLLNRHISVNTAYDVRKPAGGSNATILSRRAPLASGKTLNTGVILGGTDPGHYTAVSAGKIDMGGTGSDNGLGGNRHPGELSPIGDYLIPMLILLLCYCLFLIVRGEAREDRDEELA